VLCAPAALAAGSVVALRGVDYTYTVKLISADTCHEAQLFLVARLRDMSPNQRSQLTADAIRAGMGLPLGNTRTWDPFEVIGHVTKFLERHELCDNTQEIHQCQLIYTR
jgi:hypothetical protein